MVAADRSVIVGGGITMHSWSTLSISPATKSNFQLRARLCAADYAVSPRRINATPVGVHFSDNATNGTKFRPAALNRHETSCRRHCDHSARNGLGSRCRSPNWRPSAAVVPFPSFRTAPVPRQLWLAHFSSALAQLRAPLSAGLLTGHRDR